MSKPTPQPGSDTTRRVATSRPRRTSAHQPSSWNTDHRIPSTVMRSRPVARLFLRFASCRSRTALSAALCIARTRAAITSGRPADAWWSRNNSGGRAATRGTATQQGSMFNTGVESAFRHSSTKWMGQVARAHLRSQQTWPRGLGDLAELNRSPAGWAAPTNSSGTIETATRYLTRPGPQGWRYCAPTGQAFQQIRQRSQSPGFRGVNERPKTRHSGHRSDHRVSLART